MPILYPRGEKQINLQASNTDGLAGAQNDPAVVALSNGNFVVVYEDPASGNTANVDLLAHFFAPNGNAIMPPAATSLANGVVGVDQTLDVTIQPAIAATANGGFVVAYSEETAGTIQVRTYNPATGMSTPFTVYSRIGRVNTHDLTSASIATFADGNILVAWDEVLSAADHNVDAAFLNPTATGFVVAPNNVTSYPTFQGESRIATFGNTAALVYAADPGTLNGGWDIVLNFVNSTGTALAAPTFVFGTNSADVWSHPDVAALPDGRFVVVAEDDTTGMIAQAIVDPTTHVVASGIIATGSNPHVASEPYSGPTILNGTGGYYVTFQSTEFDSGDVIYENPNLSTFVEPGGAIGPGIQDENALAINANGTVFGVWQDTNASNPNSTDTDTRIEGYVWENPADDHAPGVTAPIFTATHGQNVAAGSLFGVTDADNDPITAYQFWDSTADPASGHWVVGGVAQGVNQAIDVTPAQLTGATFQSGSGLDILYVRASDGIAWGAWAVLYVTAPIDTGPTISVANLTANPLQSFSGNSLFTNYTDPFNSPAAQYGFWNSGTGGGHFVLNGATLPSGQGNTITAAQLSQLSYQSGSGADTLWIRANDGTVWGAWSNAFTVTAPMDVGPVINVTNLTATHGEFFDGVSLFSYSSLFGLATQYDFWNSGDGGGHFLLNGTALGAKQDNIITAAQLAQLSYQSGSGADTLWVRANDGTVWGSWSSSFTVTGPIDTGPTLFVANQTVSHGQSISANSLALYSDPFGSPGTQFDFWDTGAGGGHFVLNGVVQAAKQDIIVTAAQLAQLTYQSGSGADTLWIRANDGTVWGPWSNGFTVTAPIDPGPTLTVNGNFTAGPGVGIAASTMFTYSDPFNSPATQYDFWNTGASYAGGHFALNGNALGTNQDNIVTAGQLAQMTYVAGSGTDTLWVRANDGTVWGSWSNSFTATAAIDLGPTLTVGNLTAAPGQSITASTLFSYGDPFNNPATQYDFWDTGGGGGHFALNGSALGANQDNIITAAQLAQATYVAGSGTDTLWVRANDGVVWGAWSNSFTVTG